MGFELLLVVLFFTVIVPVIFIKIYLKYKKDGKIFKDSSVTNSYRIKESKIFLSKKNKYFEELSDYLSINTNFYSKISGDYNGQKIEGELKEDRFSKQYINFKVWFNEFLNENIKISDKDLFIDYIKFKLIDKENLLDINYYQNNYIIFKSSRIASTFWRDVITIMNQIYVDLKNTSDYKKYILKDMENIIDNENFLTFKRKIVRLITLSQNKNIYTGLIKKQLYSDDQAIVIISAFALNEDGIPALINILKTEKNSEVIISILDHFKKFINHDGIIDIFYKYIEESEDENLLNYIIEFFKKKKFSESVKHVLNFFNENRKLINNSLELTGTLINYFGILKVKESAEWLIELLKNENEHYLLRIINALGKIKDTKAVEFLKPFTKFKYQNAVRKTAKDAIQMIQKDIPETNKGNLMILDDLESGQLSVDENNDQGKLSIEKEKKTQRI